jgi:multidrug resistance efflux pump/CRP-like cAMP-binding protein
MAVEASAGNHAPLLYRTAPFSKMEAARRFQLLWQSRAMHYSRGEQIFSADRPPSHVLLIFEGEVSVFGELPAERGPVLLDEMGPGACVGWSAALTGVPGVCAVATSEVDGLLIPAPAFLEITRYDPAIKEAIYSKPWRAEAWRAVIAEMDRRTGRLRSARGIVDAILPECLARDWPEDEAEIQNSDGYVWVVVGGEGVEHGTRWTDGDGVLWARLIGLPELKLNEFFIEVHALATVEPEVSPTRSNAAADPKSERTTAVSKSEVRVPSVAPSRSQSVQRETPGTRTGRMWVGLLVGFVCLILSAGASIAYWASRQPVVRTISLPGRLLFAGETRPLQAGTAGTLAEFNVNAGQRVEAGAVIGVVRPPFDEARYRSLQETLAKAKLDATNCEQFLAGTAAPQPGWSSQLLSLANEHARLSGEARVFGAILRGGKDLTGLNDVERRRVTGYFAKATAEQSDQLDMAARDASTRSEDLREAEDAVREAQEEVRQHQQSFAGAQSENKKEAAQELADYRRVLGVLSKQVAARQEVVNRLRREIQVMRAEAAPVAPVLMDEVRDQATQVQAALAGLEMQLQAHGRDARKQITEAEAALERFRLESVPRQVIARASGLVREVSALPVGAAVTAETVLAQFVTRELWQIECALSSRQAARLERGQPVRISYSSPTGDRAWSVEPLSLTDAPDIRMRLQTRKDEWRDGMAVQMETDVVLGTLLDQWLGKLPPW